MSLFPAVFQTLKSSADVKAIVGTNPPRIYRHGEAPQRDPAAPLVPFVTWFIVAGVPENTLSELPPTDRYTVQVDCWHPTDAGVELLALACRDACEPLAHMTGMPINERERDTRLFHIALQFDWFHSRSQASSGL